MAGGVMSLGDFQNAIHEGLVSRWVSIGRDKQPDMIPLMFNRSGSNQAVEIHTLYNGFDLMVPIEEGGTAPPDSFEQQESKYYTHQEYRKSFNVTRKLLDDGKGFDVMQKGTQQLSVAYTESQNIMGYSVVNNAFSAELAADGVAIISTSHKSTAGTTSNRLSTNAAISEASLEQINIEIKKFKNDRGIKINLRPVSVRVPVDLDAETCRLLNNPDRPATADRDINYLNKTGVFPGGYQDIVYISDTANWFVMTNEGEDGLMFMDRVNLEVKTTVDDETDNMIVRSYARWTQGCSNHICMFASQGL